MHELDLAASGSLGTLSYSLGGKLAVNVMDMKRGVLLGTPLFTANSYVRYLKLGLLSVSLIGTG
ncbi:MAG TPA: hypothetical protein VH762_04150 [Gemmatimonadaceae bacterium]